MSATPIFVLGVPRAGTSWVGAVLSRGAGFAYVNEPDSPGVGANAEEGTKTVGRRPILALGEDPPADYVRLWDEAFAAPEGEVIVVKSVKAHGTLDWIARRYQPRVVIVGAHPLNVVSSWHSMGWFAGPMTREWFVRMRPELLASAGGWPRHVIEQIALRVGTLFVMQDEVRARHPDSACVVHEELCRDPVGAFARLYADLGLTFDDRATDFVSSTDAPGAGHDITRDPMSAPRRWRRLSRRDRRRARRILDRLPLELDPAALR